MSTKPVLRCAIYTRKSTEEGLEQEFNSLDAQRESCAAYIASQKHEGWQMIKTHYDDGGFTGGNMERPALKALLADIVAGKVNVIVVYKVDRLSRSLHDFAKMVEVFDKHNVSFVSVTQQFNTTTSMGRLTLNVLLSFAQFEREVTGERIRDKIAASRQKGMWMGGPVPFGYNVVERKLVINSQEADSVRFIFNKYLELGCVRLLKDYLDAQGLRSKTRTKKDGTVIEGFPFSRGSLYKILSNPIYIGQIRHRDVCYPGQHTPIVDQALWDTVQHSMVQHRVVHKARSFNNAVSPLTGKLFDVDSEPLTPTHAYNNGGRRYRYYISGSLITDVADQTKDGWRLPAQETESAVATAVCSILKDKKTLIEVMRCAKIDTAYLPSIFAATIIWCERLQSATEQAAALNQLVTRVEMGQQGFKVSVTLVPLLTGIATCDNTEVLFVTRHIQMQIKRRGVEMRLVIYPADAALPTKADPALLKALARAHTWFAALASGQETSIKQLAAKATIDPSYVGDILRLAFLAPDITEAILHGQQPPDLTLQRLIKHTNIPYDWNSQRHLLGFV